MADEGSAAAAAAALRRKRVLERGKDRLRSITVGGPRDEDLQEQHLVAAATTAIESNKAAAATTTTTATATTTEAAPLPPPTTAPRGAAAVLDRARTEIPPSPRGASRSKSGGGTAGGRGAAAATAEKTTQLLFARRAAMATAEDVTLAALRASCPARLLLAAAAPILLPIISKSLSAFAVENSSFQLLTPLATALAALCTSRPLLLLLTVQAWVVAVASALLVSRPSVLGASLEDSPTPAGPLRSLAKLAGFARGEEAARRLRWVAVAADAVGAARDACAVYLVSAVACAYYHSFSLAREMDAVAAAAATAATGGSASAVEESWS